MNITAQDILDEYRVLKRIAAQPGEWTWRSWFFNEKPRHQRHYEQYNKLQRLMWRNQDAVIELVFGGLITDESELLDLITFGMCGSCASRDNPQWQRFMAQVIDRKDEFNSPMLKDMLTWYREVHGF